MQRASAQQWKFFYIIDQNQFACESFIGNIVYFRLARNNCRIVKLKSYPFIICDYIKYTKNN